MAIEKITVTQHNGGPQDGPPATTEVIKHEGGGFPSIRESKAQRMSQVELDTTVVANKHGEGDSKLPINQAGWGRKRAAAVPIDEAQKGSPAKKVETPTSEAAEAPDGNGGQSKADADRTRKANVAVQRSREKDRQLKEAQGRLAELEKQGVRAAELEELVASGKREPIKAVAKLLGLPESEALNFLASALLNDGKPPPGADPEVVEMKRKLDAIEEREKRAQASAQEQAQFDAKAGFLNGINQVLVAAVEQDETAFELVRLKGAQPASPGSPFKNAASEDAWQIAEFNFQQTGKVLTHQQVAQLLETHYENEAEAELETLSRSKKLSNRFRRDVATREETIDSKEGSKKGRPTLGSQRLANDPKSLAPATQKRYPHTPAGDKERLKDAIATMEAKKKAISSARA